MAVVARKRSKTTTYYVTFQHQGRAVWERSGTDRREAERLDARRKRELAAGTYEPRHRRRAPTVEQYAKTWGDRRNNPSADDDRRNLKRFKPLYSMLLEDVRPRHIIGVLDELKKAGDVSVKSLQNAYGTFRTMCRDAVIAEVLTSNPCVLPRGYFDDHEAEERESYTAAELVVLTSHHAIDPAVRVLNALCLLAGLREGEACGRRWKDLDLAPEPLPCLDVRGQYEGRATKTRRARVVPVHPELARILADWAGRGFEELTTRKPTPDDFIVPRLDRRHQLTHHTKSTYNKAFVRACAAAGVRYRTLHSTRHTFITLCRRGGCNVDALSTVTHNARGTIVDRYTHRDWQELCDVVLSLRLDARLDPRRTLTSPQDSGPENTRTSTPLLMSAGVRADVEPYSIPGASIASPAKKGSSKKQRQDSRQEKRPAPVSTGELGDFEIAVAEDRARASAAGVIWPPWPKPLPAVVRVALHRRPQVTA